MSNLNIFKKIFKSESEESAQVAEKEKDPEKEEQERTMRTYNRYLKWGEDMLLNVDVDYIRYESDSIDTWTHIFKIKDERVKDLTFHLDVTNRYNHADGGTYTMYYHLKSIDDNTNDETSILQFDHEVESVLHWPDSPKKREYLKNALIYPDPVETRFHTFYWKIVKDSRAAEEKRKTDIISDLIEIYPPNNESEEE